MGIWGKRQLASFDAGSIHMVCWDSSMQVCARCILAWYKDGFGPLLWVGLSACC